jgi:hypothetical protein
MPKKKRALTDLEKEYRKARKRIKQLIARAENRGFAFPVSILPKEVKRVTAKSVERLQKITPESIYKKAVYIDPETGKTVKGTEGRKIERSRAARKHGSKQPTRTASKKTQGGGSVSNANIRPRSEIDKELERVNKLITNLKDTAKQRGYLFPKGFFEELEENARKMDIDSLKGITEASVLGSEKSRFKDPRTGTIFTGLEGLKIEAHRKKLDEQHKLSLGTDVSETTKVLDLVKEYINNWSPSNLWTGWFSEVKGNDKKILQRILEGAISAEGKEAVAQRIQDNATEIWELLEAVLYNSGGENGRNTITFDLVRFSAIIMGRPLTQGESEFLTDLSEQSEEQSEV